MRHFLNLKHSLPDCGSPEFYSTRPPSRPPLFNLLSRRLLPSLLRNRAEHAPVAFHTEAPLNSQLAELASFCAILFKPVSFLRDNRPNKSYSFLPLEFRLQCYSHILGGWSSQQTVTAARLSKLPEATGA